MIRLSAALACVLALAACADLLQGLGFTPGDTSARDSRESREVIELIGYAQKVAALRGEEQQRELNASSQMFSKRRGPYARVRYALLLALPGTAFNDDAKAAELLESPATAASGSTPGPMQQFAALLYAQVGERLREQRRTAQLKEQLDAMKDVERNIIEREQVRPR
jgi:hypothetical protein